MYVETKSESDHFSSAMQKSITNISSITHLLLLKPTMTDQQPSTGTNRESANVCCICLNSLDASQDALASFPCQHQVHLICSLTHLVSTSASTCPMCRAPLQRRVLAISNHNNSSEDNTNLASLLSQWTTPIRDTTTLHGQPFYLTNSFHGMILTETDDYKIVQRRETLPQGQLWQAVGDKLLKSVSSGRYLSLPERHRAEYRALLVTSTQPKVQFEYCVESNRLLHVQSIMNVEPGAGDGTDQMMLWLWGQDDDYWQRWEQKEELPETVDWDG